MKTSVQRVLTTLTLLWVAAFGQNAQAVVPAPDGGYPNFTTAEGTNALKNLTTGAANTAVGWYSLFSASAASYNTAIGAGSLLDNTADFNTATGTAALLSNTTGSLNTANGLQALVNNTTGSGNTALGVQAGVGVTTASNVICIGAGGDNVSDSCYIQNIFNQSSPSGTAVFVNSAGKLGTSTSSRRFKEEIKPMDTASDAILALQPVTFRYKKEFDPTGTAQFGLLAEDVEKVNPDLIVRDRHGKPYSVRYDQVNAMLLNEFLKEHNAFLEQRRKVQKLEAALEAVNERLREQEAKIETVSVQVQTGEAVPRLVTNQR